ncbi:MAG: hypothetical protein Q9164_001383 [Protoblastenia rupestris]
MGRSQKVMLCGIFALGGFATVISIIRLVSLIRLSTFSSDPTADLVNALIWTNVEVNVAIVSVLAPTLDRSEESSRDVEQQTLYRAYDPQIKEMEAGQVSMSEMEAAESRRSVAEMQG